MYCVVCKAEYRDRKLLMIKVREEDKDLLPFEYLGTPVCLLCQPFATEIEPLFLWTNIVDLMERGLCSVLPHTDKKSKPS